MINIFLVEDFFFFTVFNQFKLDFFYLFKFRTYQRMVCHEIYTLSVQMCVKSQVGYLPREAGTIGQRFSF